MPDPSYTIGATSRSLEVLEAIAEEGGITLSELSERIGAAKPTLLRHLRVLTANGYVSFDRMTKRYSLGERLIYLGYAARRQLGLTEVSLPIMRRLRDRYDETVHLGVLSRADVLHVAVAPSRQPLKMATPVGERTFAHVSALGKVLLAWGDEATLKAVLERRGLPRLTERTLADREALEEELERIRERGWSVDDEESTIGLRCIGAPVRDGSGHVTAAVSMSAPSTRLTRSAARRAAPDLLETAARISTSLGYVAGEARRGLVDSEGEALMVETETETGMEASLR